MELTLQQTIGYGLGSFHRQAPAAAASVPSKDNFKQRQLLPCYPVAAGRAQAVRPIASQGVYLHMEGESPWEMLGMAVLAVAAVAGVLYGLGDQAAFVQNWVTFHNTIASLLS